MPEESSFPTLKRLLVGKPIPSHQAHHERLSRVTGLAVLSSDALSSVAYATDFIIATLIAAGTAALGYALPIAFVIAALLAIVAFSYRQTIHAYPTGGGAYRVAKENIAENAGLTAAASLLVDYTLTVSVSISAGVLAITSAFPSLDESRVPLCLMFLALLTVGNLPDGRVEVAAEGEAESMDRFERAIRHGPPGARVDRVDVFDDVPGSRGAGFSVR